MMPGKMNAGKTGNTGEKAAEGFLIRKGYEILARNYRIRGGEIDIIASRGEYIVFAEVKTRNTASLARPSAWVDYRKQKKIIRTAADYIAKSGTDLQPRFDVIEIVYDKNTEIIVNIRHIEDAFMQSGEYAPY